MPSALSIVSEAVYRSPHGERGLKSARMVVGFLGVPYRSPHGERGLK